MIIQEFNKELNCLAIKWMHIDLARWRSVDFGDGSDWTESDFGSACAILSGWRRFHGWRSERQPSSLPVCGKRVNTQQWTWLGEDKLSPRSEWCCALCQLCSQPAGLGHSHCPGQHLCCPRAVLLLSLGGTEPSGSSFVFWDLSKPSNVCVLTAGRTDRHTRSIPRTSTGKRPDCLSIKHKPLKQGWKTTRKNWKKEQWTPSVCKDSLFPVTPLATQSAHLPLRGAVRASAKDVWGINYCESQLLFKLPHFKHKVVLCFPGDRDL